MKSDAKKVKFSIAMDPSLREAMQEIADAFHGGNLSAAFEEAARERKESQNGPMSKVWNFLSEIRRTLSSIGISTTHQENAVDWILPQLRLGLEAKLKYTSGKSEQAMISALAYTAGQDLCDEIWIVGSDRMTEGDRQLYLKLANDFDLLPVRFVYASQLSAALRERAEKRGLKLELAEPPNEGIKNVEARAAKRVAKHYAHQASGTEPHEEPGSSPRKHKPIGNSKA